MHMYVCIYIYIYIYLFIYIDVYILQPNFFSILKDWCLNVWCLSRLYNCRFYITYLESTTSLFQGSLLLPWVQFLHGELLGN